MTVARSPASRASFRPFLPPCTGLPPGPAVLTRAPARLKFNSAAGPRFGGGQVIVSPDSNRGSGAGHAAGGRGSLPPAFVEDVRRAVGIVAAVEAHVTLKRAGRTLKGLCPFHAEKTPSFHVDEAKGFFHCFGCHAGGDVFKFIMMQEALAFPEAVRALAARAGIAAPEPGPATPEDSRRGRLLALNEAAQGVFAEELAGGGRSPAARAAQEYLRGRGIGPEVIAAFGLGFAPDAWEFLLSRLAGFEAADVVAAGLAVQGERGRGAYDRFRGRVTFPIRAVSGRILAFGGRLVAAGEPKYLNSPETVLYTKGEHLFGLDRARAAIRREGEAVLVEGYLDCIALHASGVEHAVAVLGTALTPQQARLLARFTSGAVLNFDGDAAGVAAARRSIEVLLAEGFDVKVASLPQGRDPDDHVRAVGAAAYRELLAAADGFVQHLVARAAVEHDLGEPAGRVAALGGIVPMLLGVRDRILRSELVDVAAAGLGLRADLVHEEIRRTLRRRREPGGAAPEPLPPEASAAHAERTLLAWMLVSEAVREGVRTAVDDAALQRLSLGPAYRAVLARGGASLDVHEVIEELESAWLRIETGRLAMGDERVDPLPVERLAECVASFVAELGIGRVADARRLKAELDRRLDRARAEGDEDLARQLLAEAAALARTIHA